VPGADGGGCERPGQSGVDREVERLADEVLARQRHEHRVAERDQLVEPAGQLERVPRVLAEVVGRVDDDRVRSYACGGGLSSQLADASCHLREDVVVADTVRVGAWQEATRVRAHDAGVVLGHDVAKLVVGPGPRVVDQIGTCLEHLVGDLAAPGVHADHQGRVAIPDGKHEVDDPAAFLVDGHLRSVPGLHPTDVDDPRAVLDGAVDGAQGVAPRERRAPVVERVRRAVDDRHHHELGVGEHACAQAKRHGTPHGRVARSARHRSPGTRVGQGERGGRTTSMFWLQVLVALGVVLATVLVAGGRGDGLGRLSPDRPPARLPADRSVQPEDVHALRLGVGLRGYRMVEVDDALDLLAEELARRDEEIARFRRPHEAHGTAGAGPTDG